MEKTVRCKFKCLSKREFQDYANQAVCYDYKFCAVIGSANASDENKKFWKYTPSGELNVTTVMDGTFEVGKEYYLDLSLAEEVSCRGVVKSTPTE